MFGRYRYVAFCLTVGLSAFLGLRSLRGKSPTYDEYSYYGLGKEILVTGSWEKPGTEFHPPLSYYIHSLPLFLKKDQRPYGNLKWSRSMLFLTSLILGVTGAFIWAGQLYGAPAGVLAAILVGFDPNMLAHERLITPDATLASLWLVSLWLWWAYLRKGHLARLIGSSAALGLALLTKYTAILLGGLWIVAGAILGRGCRRRAVLGGAASLLGAWLILLAGYGFREVPSRIEDITPRSRLFQSLARHPWLASAPLPVPSPYLRGIDLQNVVAEEGWPAFLLGRHSKRGWWYYFFVAIAIKTPLPLFALLGLRALGSHRRDDAFVLLPGGTLLCYLSFVGRVNIGLRYLLPLYPLLCVYASGSIAGPRRWRKGAAVVLAGWFIVASASIYPDYLAYFNELVGGPRNGYRYLVDSNLDWGQDDDRAISFARGSAEPVHVNPGCTRIDGLVLVGATKFQGLPGMPGLDVHCYDWLRELEPVGHVGYSYLLFRVPRTSSTEARE